MNTTSNSNLPRRTLLALAAGATAIVLAGCGSGSGGPATSTTAAQMPMTSSMPMTPSMSPMSASSAMSSMPSMSAGGSSMPMHHSDGGAAPAGIKTAAHPKYPVGSKVTLTADHMAGMNGASATVVGAFSTFTYAVDYTPTTGGAIVGDHKWVVQQEIRAAGTGRLPNGRKVVLTADHMPGMDGATATIVSSTAETVYMVDYSAGGMTVRNHKWVVESEMKAVS